MCWLIMAMRRIVGGKQVFQNAEICKMIKSFACDTFDLFEDAMDKALSYGVSSTKPTRNMC